MRPKPARPFFTGKASVAIALALIVSGCQDKGDDGATTTEASSANADTVTAALGNNADLSTSAKMIKAAQLNTALDGAGSYTLFLPVDSAWSSLGAAERAALESAESKPQLVAVLRQHIAPGYVLATDLDKGLAAKDGTVKLTTMGTAPISLRREGDAIMLGASGDAPRIVGKPIIAGDNVIYRIDKLIPPAS